MASHPPALDVELCNLKSDSFWKEVYPLLQSFARHLVYTSHVPSWEGKEIEVIEDIVQETCRRIIERSQKVDHGEATPIQSLKNMLLAISHNYCEDLRRRDRRQLRTQRQDALFREQCDLMAPASLAEVGTENAYNEVLFRMAAREVAAFPNKQRRAILDRSGLPYALWQAVDSVATGFPRRGYRFSRVCALCPRIRAIRTDMSRSSTTHTSGLPISSEYKSTLLLPSVA